MDCYRQSSIPKFVNMEHNKESEESGLPSIQEMKKYLRENHVFIAKNPKTKKDLPNEVIIGLYREKVKSTSYYANLPEATMPEKNMKYLNDIKPFYSSVFNNGAVFVCDKEKLAIMMLLGLLDYLVLL